MSASSQSVSVVIPTHDRRESLVRALRSLCNQSHPVSEVIVAANGCAPGVHAELTHATWPFALRVLELEPLGAGLARNAGAACAASTLLLFLDDDMAAAPGMVAAHVAAHAGGSDRVVIGASRPVMAGSAGFLAVGLRTWWEELFYEMARPAHRFTYRDLLAGNLSLSRGLFARVGGFAEHLRCREDYELAARLLQLGAELVFASEAESAHHDASDLRRSFARAREEGVSDVHIARAHPALRSTLPAMRPSSSFPARFLRRMLFLRPEVGDALAAVLGHGLIALEAMRLRRPWRALHAALRDYWYWRGFVSELPTVAEVVAFLEGDSIAVTGKDIHIDLAQGLQAAGSRLDEERPAAVTLMYDGQPLGRVEAEPGAESLRSAHLAPILLGVVAPRLLAAIAMRTATDVGRVSTSNVRP